MAWHLVRACPEGDQKKKNQGNFRVFAPHGFIYRVAGYSCVYLYKKNFRMTSPNHIPDDAQRFRQEALRWLVRRQDVLWGAQDEMAFQRWLAADPLHATAYAHSEERWSRLDGMPDDLRARMRQRLQQDKASLSARTAPQPSRRRFLAWPMASGAVMAAVVGGGYVAWQHVQAQPMSVQAFHTERGLQKNVSLTDGSRLRMDTATDLEVRFYRQRRELQLHEGQVVLEVQHDGRPFHVLAGHTRVTVVGTRFSVRYTPGMPGNAGVQVAVEEGKVRVAALDEAEIESGAYNLQAGILLTAGQQIASDAQGALGAMLPVPADGIAPWRDQRISFVDIPLAQALAEVERYRPTGLLVRDPQVAAMRLSGTFDPMATSVLHKALPRALPVRLQANNGLIEVVPIK